jgi:hypothetical protein
MHSDNLDSQFVLFMRESVGRLPGREDGKP